jgi:UDP-N-acetylmuramyl tripeptide synthase
MIHLSCILQSLTVEDQEPKIIPDLNITGIQFHSNKVQPGNIFVAIEGYQHDGHKYIEDAIRAGAAAIVGMLRLFGCKKNRDFRRDDCTTLTYVSWSSRKV